MLDAVLRIALVAATGFLFFIVLLAYLRIKSVKLFFIASGFAVFLVHALLYMPEVMFSDYTFKLSDNVHVAFNLVALSLITVGILREEK